MTETRLKIAVFIDFDNIEIGVKTTLNTPFDIGVVLEAVKERGEVVTKVAYSDWKRAGDYSRQLSQHAIRMVQRNLTPGGDKNGADINLALDALEMAFTHDHINAFVIVGGDSDFITLVEKLKQYDKKVIVVGGRQFTSLVMQKNCHEFVAYENLVSTRRGSGAGRARSGAPTAASDLDKALPLVKRALKVLSDREVTPQLGLLKSTLLQLDSTFSERNYGASTFRDFIDKVAERGLVTLRQAGRSVLVELADSGLAAQVSDQVPTEPMTVTGDGAGEDVNAGEPSEPRDHSPTVSASRANRPQAATDGQPGPSPDAVQIAAGLFVRARQTPRWPMYIRQIRQYLRSVDETFDERKLGFPGIVEFLRACQREGLLRLDRDRQGVLRVFPGQNFVKPATEPTRDPSSVEIVSDIPIVEGVDAAAPAGETIESRFTRITDAPGETMPAGNAPVDVVVAAASGDEDLSVGPGNVEQPSELRARSRARKTPAPRATKRIAAPRAARAPRARKSARSKTGE